MQRCYSAAAMFNLARRWPLGLTRRNCTDYATMVVFVLFVLLFFDVWVSRSVQGWAQEWRDPFTFVIDFGLSEWVLIPAVFVCLPTLALSRLLPFGLARRALLELALLSSFIFLSVGVPGLAANILKRIFGRSRPMQYLETRAFRFQTFTNDWSFQGFPSGHATTAMATALVVGFVAPSFFRLFLLIAVIAGVSRVVVGLHYPTDVAAGFVVGAVGAFAVCNF